MQKHHKRLALHAFTTSIGGILAGIIIEVSPDFILAASAAAFVAVVATGLWYEWRLRKMDEWEQTGPNQWRRKER